MQVRFQNLDNIQQYVGEFFSKEWIMKNILMFDEDDMKEMQKQIAAEKASGEIDDEKEEEEEAPPPMNGNGGQQHSIDINVNGANNGN